MTYTYNFGQTIRFYPPPGISGITFSPTFLYCTVSNFFDRTNERVDNIYPVPRVVRSTGDYGWRSPFGDVDPISYGRDITRDADHLYYLSVSSFSGSNVPTLSVYRISNRSKVGSYDLTGAPTLDFVLFYNPHDGNLYTKDWNAQTIRVWSTTGVSVTSSLTFPITLSSTASISFDEIIIVFIIYSEMAIYRHFLMIIQVLLLLD